MAILKVKDSNGNFVEVPLIAGASGEHIPYKDNSTEMISDKIDALSDTNEWKTDSKIKYKRIGNLVCVIINNSNIDCASGTFTLMGTVSTDCIPTNGNLDFGITLTGGIGSIFARVYTNGEVKVYPSSNTQYCSGTFCYLI